MVAPKHLGFDFKHLFVMFIVIHSFLLKLGLSLSFSTQIFYLDIHKTKIYHKKDGRYRNKWGKN